MNSDMIPLILLVLVLIVGSLSLGLMVRHNRRYAYYKSLSDSMVSFVFSEENKVGYISRYIGIAYLKEGTTLEHLDTIISWAEWLLEITILRKNITIVYCKTHQLKYKHVIIFPVEDTLELPPIIKAKYLKYPIDLNNIS